MNKKQLSPKTDYLKRELCQKSKIASELPNDWNWVAPADFASNLEHKLDEALEQLENIRNVIPVDAPCLHAETGETVADYSLGLQKEVGRVHALYFNDKQQLEAMREAIKEAYEVLRQIYNHGNGSEVYPAQKDEHPDCSWCVRFRKTEAALAKLQPFLKP